LLECYLQWHGYYDLLKEKQKQRHQRGEFTDDEAQVCDYKDEKLW